MDRPEVQAAAAVGLNIVGSAVWALLTHADEVPDWMAERLLGVAQLMLLIADHLARL